MVQDGGQFMQAVQVSAGQLLQYAVTCPGQADTDHTAVTPVRCPLHQPGGLRAVDQFHHAVRSQEQVACEVADGRRLVPRMSFDRHEQLMLHVRKALNLSLVLAPALKAPQSDTEL
ncbi:MAG TPA: hypothetical protein VIY52_00455 [Streptosporangiaceae bacterium]